MVKYRTPAAQVPVLHDPGAAPGGDGAASAADAPSSPATLGTSGTRTWMHAWRPATQAPVEVRWSSAPDDGFEVSLWFAERVSTRRRTPVPQEKFMLLLQGRLDANNVELPFSLRAESDPQPMLRGMFVWNRGTSPELWIVDLVHPGGRVARACLTDHAQAG